MSGDVIPLDSRRPLPLHMMTEEQEAEALTAIRAARRKRDRAIDAARTEFNDTIRAHVEAGLRVTDVAVAAEFSRARIYQIRDERR